MKCASVMLGVLALVCALYGQAFRGTVLGTVTDPSGATVSGARITVRSVDTGLERSTQTSPDGSYVIPELPIGIYAVTISQTGFQEVVVRNVEVNVAGERRVDAQLKPGKVSERIDVSGEALPQIETTSTDLGGILTSRETQDIAINGRDYTKLIYLNPGVAGSPDQITDSPGSFGVFFR